MPLTDTASRLRWKPLAPFGAEISFDLNAELSPADQAALRDLLWRFEVLVFRDQALSHERQIEVMEYIAPVLRTHEGAHYISTDKEIGALGKMELPFHSDLSFVAEPRLALSLHAVDVVEGASSTKYISGSGAVARLAPELRKRLEKLNALHVFPTGEYNRADYVGALPDWLPRHSHPAFLPHPVTGKPILYITQMQTARFDDVEPDENARLLADVRAILYSPDHVFEHVWRNGDLVIWDNLATQHARGDVSSVGRRTLQKVQTGTKSFAEQWPAFSSEHLQTALGEMR